jgi:hypothetical protein
MDRVRQRTKRKLPLQTELIEELNPRLRPLAGSANNVFLLVAQQRFERPD